MGGRRSHNNYFSGNGFYSHLISSRGFPAVSHWARISDNAELVARLGGILVDLDGRRIGDPSRLFHRKNNWSTAFCKGAKPNP
jgi:hypothetical protein